MNPLLHAITHAADERSKNSAMWTLQLLMLEHFHKVHKLVSAFREKSPDKIETILVERNAESSLIFAELPGSPLNKDQRANLRERAENSRIQWDLRILVTTPVELCLKRIANRKRDHEKWLLTTETGKQYLKNLEVAMYAKHKMISQNEPSEVIDGSKTKDQMVQKLMPMLI